MVVGANVDVPFSMRVASVPWASVRAAADLGSGTGRTGVWLRQRGIQRLIVGGIRTEQCCETTTRVASDLGYRVTFVTEATLTFPMRHPGGEVFTPAQLKRHTETVLVDRFARIASVDEALAQLAQE